MTAFVWDRAELLFHYLYWVPVILIGALLCWWLGRRVGSALAGAVCALVVGAAAGTFWERLRRRIGPPKWEDVTRGADLDVLLPEEMRRGDGDGDDDGSGTADERR